MQFHETMKALTCAVLALALAPSYSLRAQTSPTLTNPLATPAITAAANGTAASSGAGRISRSVRFVIDMRSEIAAGRFDAKTDGVGVRGAAPPLSWSQSILATSEGDGLYAASVVFDRPATGGQPLQYKFRIERAGLGPNAGWEDGRNHALLLRESGQTVSRAFNSSPKPVPLERTGRIDRIAPLPSRFVAPREVQVWLPPGYEREDRRRYRVLYLHDGQVMFDAEAAGAEWQFDETAQRLVLAGAIEPFIIVAVSNNRDRMDEYTPTGALRPAERTGFTEARRIGGAASKYADYLVKELKPLIDRRYRTRPDAASTATGGSSLAGLLTLWLVMHHHDVFGAGLVVSPSVWWDDQFALRDAATAPLPAMSRPKLWLDIGTLEGAEALPVMRKLRNTLSGRGWNESTLSYMEAADATHDEASWALRVEGMLRFLYGKTAGN